MKVALISTVYNEAASLNRWIEALRLQTVRPDEFVIVDGGSSDDTVRLLRDEFGQSGFLEPTILVRRCNIAEGRNLAIRNTTAEIIVSIDAGSVPDRDWLNKITEPFIDSCVDVVGGQCPCRAEGAFQKRIEKYCTMAYGDIAVGADCAPSSRNVAFRRKAWGSVGGYPEWLTLTAEDALFNVNLHVAGYRFYYQPSALVSWEARPDLASYLKMMWHYGYGSGEMNQGTKQYLSWMATTLFPPLIALSRNPVSELPLRYLRNAYAALGWVAGKISGRKPPEGWIQVNGEWLSPETVATIEKRLAANSAD